MLIYNNQSLFKWFINWNDIKKCGTTLFVYHAHLLFSESKSL